MSDDKKQVVLCHLVFRLTYGGLENGLINLVNRLPRHRYRHIVICLTESGEFENRIDDQSRCRVIALGKKPKGTSVGIYFRLWWLLVRIRPDIVHTRNLPVIDLGLVAKLALVPKLIHSEHGLDVTELSGVRKYIWMRRLLRPLVSRYIALGKDLRDWLVREVKVTAEKVDIIYNGVDTERFHPPSSQERQDLLSRLPKGFRQQDSVIIGTVGRMAALKRPARLVQAVGHLAMERPALAARLRVIMVGDGEHRPDVEAAARRFKIEERLWITGFRDDVAELMRCMDIFVLPSLREGLSNTVLEAMSSGLPVVATAVGGTPELVEDNATGILVLPERPDELANAIARLVEKDDLRSDMGLRGRERICDRFSIDRMIEQYDRVYRRVAGHD